MLAVTRLWTFLLKAAQTTLLPHLFTGRRHLLDSILNGTHLHHANTKSESRKTKRPKVYMISYRFDQFITTRYTTDFNIIKREFRRF